MKKGLAIGLGCGAILVMVLGCMGLFGGIAWLGFSKYTELTTATNDFLAKVAAGDTAGAYQSGAAALRSAQSESEFASAVKKMGLTEYQSGTWTAFNIVNDSATIEGSVTTKSGGTIPLKVSLVNEAGGWKVAGLSLVGVGAASTTTPPPLPSDAELKTLARTTLKEFNAAVKKEDFSDFYASISDVWKKQTTADELETIFKVFIDKEIDISAVQTATPVFDPTPKIDENGVLQLIGSYDVKPAKVSFTLKYVSESGAWKLMGINVKTGN